MNETNEVEVVVHLENTIYITFKVNNSWMNQDTEFQTIWVKMFEL